MKNRGIRHMEIEITFITVKDDIGKYDFKIVKWDS